MSRELRILAVNPGSRYLGIAFFQGVELRDWKVKILKGEWSREKMEKAKKIVSFLIDYWRPNVLVIKLLHPSRSSRNLKILVAKIKVLSKKRGLKVYQYSIKEIEDFFFTKEKMNKRKLAEMVASRYTELIPQFEKEKNHRNPYHIRMFEAVALGATCSYKLDK